MDNLPTTSQAYEELGPTRRSTSSEPRAPPKTARLIGELGLRFRPSAQADLEAHAHALALLTRDVAHMHPDILERACLHWVQESKFMPKAAELIHLCRNLADRANTGLQGRVDYGNAHLAEIGRTDCHWVARNGNAVIEWR